MVLSVLGGLSFDIVFGLWCPGSEDRAWFLAADGPAGRWAGFLHVRQRSPEAGLQPDHHRPESGAPISVQTAPC